MATKTHKPSWNTIAEGLHFARIYWQSGEMPSKSRERNEVKDPPSSGWSSCFLLDNGGKLVTLVCPYTLWGYQVSRDAFELTTLKALPAHETEDLEDWTRRIVKKMLDNWAMCNRLNLTDRQFDLAALVLNKLNVPVPVIQRPEGWVPKPTGGKEADDVLGLLKPVKRGGRRAQVLEFFLSGPRSVLEAMAEFSVTRSNLLSQLYMLTKEHGIGYVLADDTATIVLPKGCDDPFTPLEA